MGAVVGIIGIIGGVGVGVIGVVGVSYITVSCVAVSYIGSCVGSGVVCLSSICRVVGICCIAIRMIRHIASSIVGISCVGSTSIVLRWGVYWTGYKCHLIEIDPTITKEDFESCLYRYYLHMLHLGVLSLHHPYKLHHVSLI